MTKVKKEKVICSNCKKESEQLIIYSINYSLGTKESNDKLQNHIQECPHCGYKNSNISMTGN